MKPFCIDREDFNNVLRCNAWVATAVVGSAVIGAGATIYGANKASKAQTDASQRGIDATMQMYETTRGDLAPFRQVGQDAIDLLEANKYYTEPIELTQEWLEGTPGYKFTRDQGLKAVGNAAAARGLGVSGAALKGAANFATGLADNTYKTQFDVARTNRQDAYSNLKALVDTGGNAAAQTGNAATTTGKNIADLSVGAGNAQAAAANATGGAIKNFASDVGGYAAYRGLYGNLPGPGTGKTDYSGLTPNQLDYWGSGNVGPI